MRAVCSHCGHDIAHDEPLEIDDFWMGGIDSWLHYKGTPIKLTPAEGAIAWSLMKNFPYSMTADALLNRIGSEGGPDVIDVMMCRMRKKLRDATGVQPLQNIWGRGYRWSVK